VVASGDTELTRGIGVAVDPGANTCSGGTPRATNVATRRNASCSSASRASAARPCAFAITVATRSVKSARRAPVSAGSDTPWDE
jgi:hypothetical protein